MRVMIINGPNLNLLGKRDKGHYGSKSLEEIEALVREEFPDFEFSFFQSNLEGEIVTLIQNSENNFNGLIINPGGYAHTSIAIKDALAECRIPKIEVHLSNLASREEYRHVMITAAACDGYISGMKDLGYIAAVYMLQKINSK